MEALNYINATNPPHLNDYIFTQMFFESHDTEEDELKNTCVEWLSANPYK